MRCFVVMPIGEKGTEKHRQFLAAYRYIIKDTVEPLGYTCERADEIPDSGMIPEQIATALRAADLVVADLTERNPNVMYEVGVRHALGRPLLMISQDLHGLPFDISHYRTIRYQPTDIESVSECKRRLVEYIRNLTPAEPTAPLAEPPDRPGRELRIGLENIFQTLGEVGRSVNQTMEMVTLLSSRGGPTDAGSTLHTITERLQELLSSNQLLTQMNQLGLVGIHKNRLDAIEHYFFNVLREEPKEIDIVGSTIFGLKGYRSATFERIIDILKTKHTDPNFRLRILLTHWDFISYRQDQEKTEKNIARYVISKELKDAIDVLSTKGLTDTVKFYKGSPTCFTIIAEGQKQMLMNPYPYQREAYNSCCIVVTDTFGGVYSAFKQAHFDEPWVNSQLTVPYDDACRRELAQKLEADIGLAREQILGQLATKDDRSGRGESGADQEEAVNEPLQGDGQRAGRA